MKKYVIAVLLMTLVLVSCGGSSMKGHYTSDGTYIVENGPVKNNSADAAGDYVCRYWYLNGYDDFIQQLSKTSAHLLVVRAKRIKSESTYKLSENVHAHPRAFTITEILIEDIYCQAGVFETIKPNDTMNVFECYSYKPLEDGSAEFIHIAARPSYGSSFSQRFSIFHPEFLEEGKEYVLAFCLLTNYLERLTTPFMVGDMVIPEMYFTLFYPTVAFEINEDVYKSLSETVPKDIANRTVVVNGEMNYIKYDIFDRFIFGQSEN